MTFNIHKGVSSFNARLVLHRQRELIRQLQADIVFLQEVRGAHARHQRLTIGGQHEFLAETIWPSFAYGKNAIASGGHHGNAILSKFPIMHWENENISANKIEQRGLLHCEIAVPGWSQHLHCICVHLGLLSGWRHRQLEAIQQRITRLVPPDAPLIIAGDFNDWQQKADHAFVGQQALQEVFVSAQGKHARSFPSLFPLFRLDRIYTRGFHLKHSEIHAGTRFANVSDHAALSAVLQKI